ncbi:MAG: glycoside hydrolase family 43 protein [Oscillospiraceae bacterium]|nr:glycoside hydrolase family 43 protein [Oscillospiraceae bacterium]
MRYTNPVIKGFYPDPSVCFAKGKYYMVCSSFQYFPGVPLFESEDLVNWKQIGHVLTRKTQVQLEKVNSSGGVFAPTIRHNNGRFYMVTTNDTTHENFYVYTDDIYGEWSDPIKIDRDGIDPSLLFDCGKTYFLSNGTDDNGEGGVVQCEINIATGKKLSESKCIWKGSGGRYLESPHMYKIGEYYYLMAAEGGTEYGHMITYARSKSVWGPFEGYARNPVLTNRNKAPEIIQGIGHGDLICGRDGSWHILCLGFRQIHMWMPYHTLGREVFLIPVTFDDKGWFTAGIDGTAHKEYDIEGDFAQTRKNIFTFENTAWNVDWCHLRHPDMSNYKFDENQIELTGTGITLDDMDSPTFIGIRQRDLKMELTCNVTIPENSGSGDCGLTVYSCENEHYDIALRKNAGKANSYEAVLKLNIGGIKHEQATVPIPENKAVLKIKSDDLHYNFSVITNEGEKILGTAQAKYLSSEVSGGFTGVVIGLYSINAADNGKPCIGEFRNFNMQYD